MSYSLEYARSSRARCRRCEDLIKQGDLRVGFEVESMYGPGQTTTQWLHWGCLKPAQLGQMGVNANGFHSLAAADQLRVVNAIKQRKIPDEDLSAALRAPPELPKGIAPSQTAPAAVAPSWPPSKPKKGSSLMVPRKPKPGTSSSGPANSSQPSTSGTPGASSSSQVIDITSSPVRVPPASASPSNLPTSSQSQVIDLSSSPSKPTNPNGYSTQASTEASGSGTPIAQPGAVAEGRTVKAEREAEEDESEGSPEPEDDVFYLRHQDEVVGIQHYRGLVGVGERVVLHRDPTNRYDANAIKVVNINGQQVGHIPKGTAARLARLMDARYINVEGVMLTGNIGKSGYKLKIMIDIYGQASARASLAPHLAWFGQISETGLPPPPAAGENRNGTGVSGTSSSPRKGKSRAVPETEEERAAKLVLDGLKGLEKGGDENQKDSVMDTLTQGFDVLKLPLHPNPPSKRRGQLRNDLMGLLWMQQKEAPALPTGDEHVQLWQRRSNPVPHWLNRATLTPQAISSPPELGRGGIMADSMGLGKTLTILGLVLASKARKPQGFCNATLIVCPLSVLSNWETQLQEHIVPGQLTSITFYGEGRNVRQVDLEAADLVITTYDVLSSEFTASKGKRKGKGKIGKLLETDWKRVVLDEGHTIRNPKAGKTKAAVALNAHSRWIVSGTPIVNGAKDLGSLLTFLRMCKPLDEPEQFRRHIIRTLPSGNGALLLQAIMSGSCIRRTKEMQDDDGNRLVVLPPVNFYSIKVDLHEDDRKAYDLAMAASKRKFEEFMRNERTGNLPPNVLQLLTRLRQIACLSTLVPPDYIETLQQEEERHAPLANISNEARKALIFKLKAAIDDATECPICFDELVQPRITMCGHSYCLDCISEVIKLQAACPMDRTPLPSLEHVLELPAVMPDENEDAVKEEEEKPKTTLALKSSAKIDELLKYLKAFPKGEKSLVFSQFTKFLEKIEPHLKKAGIKTVRLDGSMSQKRRAEVIDEFQNSPAVASSTNDEDEDEEDDADSSATEVSDVHEEEESDASELGSDDDDYVVQDTRKRKSRASKTRQPKGKRSKEIITSKKIKLKGKATKSKGKGRAGAQTRLADGPTVMLISLQAGSQGLNLTAAQNVFLVDPWWNSAITMQAIDRVNRIGQKAKEVRVFEIVAKDTIEDKILEIQAKKNELIQQAFAGNRTKETARQKKEARFNEIAALFGVEQNHGANGSRNDGERLVQQTL